MVKGRLVVVLLLLTLLATDWLVLSAPISSFGGLSHLTGTARKIRLYVKNKFLQILPDATVNGTTEETQYSESIIKSYLFLFSKYSERLYARGLFVSYFKFPPI